MVPWDHFIFLGVNYYIPISDILYKITIIIFFCIETDVIFFYKEVECYVRYWQYFCVSAVKSDL